MKFKDYITALNKLLQDHPEVGEYTTIYSKDDEGNGFQEVAFDPTIGFFEDSEFQSGDDLESDLNAVCIN